MKQFVVLVASFLVCCLLSGCASVFSDYQSAKMAGKGKVEITPSVTSVSRFVNKENDHAHNNIGGELAVGIHNRIDVRFGYMYLDTEGDGGFNVVGFGPKISLSPDKVALYLPVGFGFNDSLEPSETWELHPTLLFTGTISDVFEITPSVKAIFPLTNSDLDVLIAFNVGAGIGDYDGLFIFRPEIGVLTSPGDKGIFWAAGVGLTFKIPF